MPKTDLTTTFATLAEAEQAAHQYELERPQLAGKVHTRQTDSGDGWQLAIRDVMPLILPFTFR